jgi:flagellar basal-body rod protein FlgB
MFIENLISRGSAPVLEQVLAFTEARQEVIANNISNFDTVGYKAKDLAVGEFFGALSEAVKERAEGGGGRQLRMKSTSSLSWDAEGRLDAKVVEIEGNNILFHDNNNRSVEKQMSEMAQNGLLHNVAVELLRGQYTTLQMALSGRM